MDHPILVASYLAFVGVILSVIGLAINCFCAFGVLESVRIGSGADHELFMNLAVGNVCLALGVGFIVVAIRIVRRR